MAQTTSNTPYTRAKVYLTTAPRDGSGDLLPTILDTFSREDDGEGARLLLDCRKKLFVAANARELFSLGHLRGVLVEETFEAAHDVLREMASDVEESVNALSAFCETADRALKTPSLPSQKTEEVGDNDSDSDSDSPPSTPAYFPPDSNAAAAPPHTPSHEPRYPAHNPTSPSFLTEDELATLADAARKMRSDRDRRPSEVVYSPTSPPYMPPVDTAAASARKRKQRSSTSASASTSTPTSTQADEKEKSKPTKKANKNPKTVDEELVARHHAIVDGPLDDFLKYIYWTKTPKTAPNAPRGTTGDYWLLMRSLVAPHLSSADFVSYMQEEHKFREPASSLVHLVNWLESMSGEVLCTYFCRHCDTFTSIDLDNVEDMDARPDDIDTPQPVEVGYEHVLFEDTCHRCRRPMCQAETGVEEALRIAFNRFPPTLKSTTDNMQQTMRDVWGLLEMLSKDDDKKKE